MATSDHVQTALLTEHFRYTPLTLLDEIINNVNELVFRAVNAVEAGLTDAPASDLGFKLDQTQLSTLRSEQARNDALADLKQTELDNGIIQLESLLNATVDRDFDKFEIYALRNILCLGHEEEDLAPWVQLEHYKHLDWEAARQAPTPEEVQLQRRKLHETMKLNAILKAEEARNAAVLNQLQALLAPDRNFDLSPDTNGRVHTHNDDDPAPLAFLIKSAASPTLSSNVGGTKTTGSAVPAMQQQQQQQQTLTQNVRYTLSQLPALRKLLSELKEALHTLPNARHTGAAEDSAEATRTRYLDTQARRALERHGMDADAATKTAAASIGRRLGQDEIEGIRAVVRALGDGQERSGRDDSKNNDRGHDDEMQE